MVGQTAIAIEIDYTKTKDYDQVLEEYNLCLPLKYLEPVFLCYSDKTKMCFVSKIFKKETVESYNNHKIIQ